MENLQAWSWLRKEHQYHSVPYHARRNQFERFRGFLELISRFEFDFFVAKIIFFERFEFLVCSGSITCDVTVHVPVLCLFVPTEFQFECYGVIDDS